jgi:S1/P1 Nuclease
MPTYSFRSLLIVLLCAILAVPIPAGAWGNTGHEAVAYVAWRQLTAPTKARVLTLLKQVPTLHTTTSTIPGYADWVTDLPKGMSTARQNEYLFMRAATWADSIKHHGLIDSDVPPPGITTDVNTGFNDDHSHGYWHFIDTAFASDDETVPATPVPNVETQIAALRTDIASDEDDALKSYDMVFLLHLVGDIHQPLHGSVRYHDGTGDLGGNTVKVKLPTAMQTKFKCPPSTYTITELHAYWDDLPGSCPADHTGLPKAVAYAKNLPLLLNGKSLPGADKVADTDPANWAADSLALAKKDAYAAPIGPGLTPEGSTTGFVMTQAYYKEALKDAKGQIALAGARLAKLLNENLK